MSCIHLLPHGTESYTVSVNILHMRIISATRSFAAECAECGYIQVEAHNKLMLSEVLSIQEQEQKQEQEQDQEHLS